MAEPRFAVLTAARNEAAYLGYTLLSVARQTLRPTLWVIVDDGSDDDTWLLTRAAATRYPWIRPLRRPASGGRDTGAGVVAALTFGLSRLRLADYDFLFILDADILLGPHYYEAILAKFARMPRLGVATGTVWDFKESRLFPIRGQQFGMIGALKGWRRQCFEELGGLAPGEGWEGIDSLQALRRGWEAVTFPDPELRALHLKPRAHGWRRHGRALHFAGASPLWVLASGLYHLASRPYVQAGVEIWLGYLQAWRAGEPQYDAPEFRDFQRRWHLRRLWDLLPARHDPAARS
ncbi:MAG: glycosyltransferase family 2 protein [Syntrophobacterales bacterium]|nr:glycosyltransferase family 2 protein [Syntrophobacterales bacterium]